MAGGGEVESPGGQVTEEGLVRGIRRWDLVLLVLNAIIGAGIFGLPAAAFGLVGSYSLIAFLVCGAVVSLILLSFAEVAGRFTATGGPYLYAHEAYGSGVGFMMGWLLWLARLTAFAALCNLWLDYLAVFWPGAGAGTGRVVMIAVVVLVLTLVNLLGVRASTIFNDGFTVAKLLPLLAFVLVGLFFLEPANVSFGPPPDLGSFSAAVLLLVFAYSGFEVTVIPSGEAKDPRHHLPFALITGMVFVVALYLLIQLVSIGTLSGLAESTRPLADAAGQFMGPVGSTLIVAGALISITGTLNGIVLVAPRLPFAMAERGQLPDFFAKTHPRFHTPHVAIWVSGAAMLLLSLQGSFVSSLEISTVIRLVTYVATCAALPILRRRRIGAGDGFRAPGGALTAGAAIVLCLWLITSSGWGDILTTLMAGLVGAGLYFLVGRGEAPRESSR